MAKIKLQETEAPQQSQSTDLESIVLETRKVKALEKIANSLDALTIWFEEIDKKEWGERLAWYLYEFHNIAKAKVGDVQVEEKVEETPQPAPPRKVRPKKDIETV
jgi:hypothetical protein